jgi:hypothetical protein
MGRLTHFGPNNFVGLFVSPLLVPAKRIVVTMISDRLIIPLETLHVSVLPQLFSPARQPC